MAVRSLLAAALLAACASGPAVKMRVVSRAAIDGAVTSTPLDLAEAGREYFISYHATLPFEVGVRYSLTCPGAGAEGVLASPLKQDEYDSQGISGAETRSTSTHDREAMDEPPPRSTGKRRRSSDDEREVEARLRILLDAPGRCTFAIAPEAGGTLDGVKVELRLETSEAERRTTAP